METALYWMWLADAVGSAFRRAGELLAAWPDPRALYEHLRAGGNPPACLTPRARGRLAEKGPADFAGRLEACMAAGIVPLTPEDPDYPDRFRALPDRPLALYATGSTACLNGRRYVGMVGTRRPSRYGAQACHELSLAIARQGAVIVSGLADGLDGEGHRAAVEAGAVTVAFLGTAIDKTFPAANAPLRRQIEALGGAVLSEYPPDYQGRTTGTFLARNRLIAGLAEAVCVAEAGKKSGTINTVGHAERYGRPVYAVPGSIFAPTSEGTNDLLRTHRAEALCSAADVLNALGISDAPAAPVPAPAFPLESLSETARAVLQALGPRPLSPDEVVRATGLPIHRVLAALTELEFAEAAVPAPGHRYIAAR